MVELPVDAPGEEHRAHAAAAQLAHELVLSEPRPLEGTQARHPSVARDVALDRTLVGLRLGHQRLDFGAQRVVVATGAVEEGASSAGGSSSAPLSTSFTRDHGHLCHSHILCAADPAATSRRLEPFEQRGLVAQR